MCTCAKSFQSCTTLCDPVDCSPPGSSVHGDSPGNNTGVGGCALLQGIFPTQGSNLHLWHLLLSWWILYHCTTWEASFKLLEHSLYHCILVGSLNFVDPHMKGRNGGYRNKL